LSLLDQFEVQFNELSYGEIVDGELSELQPVELAGIINQEISRIQNELGPSENVESIRLSLSPHDFRRLSKFETLLKDGLEDLVHKTGELKRIDSILFNSPVLWTKSSSPSLRSVSNFDRRR
jgi:hypothetical protein